MNMSRLFQKRSKVDVSADELAEHNGDYYSDSDVSPLPVTRELVPCSTFTSFMLWALGRLLRGGMSLQSRLYTLCS